MENPENKKALSESSKDDATFQKYVEDLKLAPEDFEKKILDIGAGSARFSKWAREHGVSSQIYSLDRSHKSIKGENSIVGKAESLPFANNSFDLVISNAAIPHIFAIGASEPRKLEDDVLSSLNEAVRVLKPGGEIRLARVLMGDLYENQKVLTQSIKAALNKLKKECKLEIIEEHVQSDDAYEYDGGKRKRLLAKSYLITIRKP